MLEAFDYLAKRPEIKQYVKERAKQFLEHIFLGELDHLKGVLFLFIIFRNTMHLIKNPKKFTCYMVIIVGNALLWRV